MTGKELWAYEFGMSSKGEPDRLRESGCAGDPSKYVVMVGSRRGFPSSMSAANIAPFRAVSLRQPARNSGRLPVPHTRSYSRDADGSGFVVDGTAWVGVDVGQTCTGWIRSQPLHGRVSARRRSSREALLLGDKAGASHGGNLVLEASPTLLEDRVYAASGAGHVYGMNKDTLKFRVGLLHRSDMDGTPVATSDGYLFGKSRSRTSRAWGAAQTDRRKPAKDALVWVLSLRVTGTSPTGWAASSARPRSTTSTTSTGRDRHWWRAAP